MKISRQIILILVLFPLTALAENLQDKPLSFWQERLSPKQVEVCRQGGTERPYSGEYNSYKEKEGVFLCASCGQELFDASTKFDSRTGWPSFYKPISEGAVSQKNDSSYGMRRTEILCSNCGAHLGHVFDDGPKPTGKRYCINSVCLKLGKVSADAEE